MDIGRVPDTSRSGILKKKKSRKSGKTIRRDKRVKRSARYTVIAAV